MVADEAYIRESIVNPQAKIVEGFPPIMPTFQGHGDRGAAAAAHRLRALARRRGAAHAAGRSGAAPQPPGKD